MSKVVSYSPVYFLNVTILGVQLIFISLLIMSDKKFGLDLYLIVSRYCVHKRFTNPSRHSGIYVLNIKKTYTVLASTFKIDQLRRSREFWKINCNQFTYGLDRTRSDSTKCSWLEVWNSQRHCSLSCRSKNVRFICTISITYLRYTKQIWMKTMRFLKVM